MLTAALIFQILIHLLIFKSDEVLHILFSCVIIFKMKLPIESFGFEIWTLIWNIFNFEEMQMLFLHLISSQFVIANEKVDMAIVLQELSIILI